MMDGGREAEGRMEARCGWREDMRERRGRERGGKEGGRM